MKKRIFAGLLAILLLFSFAPTAVAGDTPQETSTPQPIQSSEPTPEPTVEPTLVQAAEPTAQTTPESTLFGVMQQAVSSSVPVTITDQNLEKVVRDRLGKPTGVIYDTDMLGLRYIDCSYKDISSLEGMQYAKNMDTLNANYNRITDVSPLAGLTNLKKLGMMSNKITDISPLMNLTNLTFLGLNSNSIAEIPSQISNLIKLETLWISENEIISLPSMGKLSKLKMLLLGYNKITDITPLKELTSLENLILSSNNISDMSPLQYCQKLTDLFLDNCKVSDCTSIGKLKGLKWLYLNNNKISDISSLSGLKKLTYLELSGNMLTNSAFETIFKLDNLEYIGLEGNMITDLNALRDKPFLLKHLQACNLFEYYIGQYGSIQDVSPGIFDPVQMAIELKYKHIIQNIFKPEMTELQKVLSIHDYVADNCAYGSGTTVFDLLMRHVASCSGYTNTMENLLTYVGIENRGIGGAGHAWNMVRIDGEYYHLDATWDDCEDIYYHYNYFLLSDDEIKELRSGPAYDWNSPESALRMNKDVLCDSIRFDFIRSLLSEYTPNLRDRISVCGSFIYYSDKEDGNKLKKVSVDGGVPITISDDDCGCLWNDGNDTIYQNNTDGKYYKINQDNSVISVNWLFVTESMPRQCGNVFPVDGSVKIKFNSDININDSSLIKLTDTMGKSVPFTYSVSKNILTVIPLNELLGLQEYTLTLPSGAVSGNGLTLRSQYSLYFSTAENKNEIAEPSVNIKRGFYDHTLNVTLSGSAGIVIYYTLDGSVPTQSSLKYSGSIHINKPSVLRYAAFSQDGKQSKVYSQIYNVNPLNNPSYYLSGINLSAGKLSRAFSKTCYKYKISLGEHQDSVTLTPIKDYDGAKMTIAGKSVSSYTVSVANGKSKTVSVKVTHGKTTKTYKFTVTRAKSTNNNLASLTASAGAFDKPFSPDTLSYTLTLDENTKSVKIYDKVASSYAKATFKSKTVSLKNGQAKTVKLTVKAQSGAKKTYTITVKRAASTNTGLKFLKTSSRSFPLTPAFSAAATDYTVTLPANKSKVTISAKAAGYKAKMMIGGKSVSSKKITLKPGESVTVRIVVTAQDALFKKEYTITITRP